MQYKILIIAPAWVGDMVMAQTLFKALKKKHKESLVLDVFAPSFAGGLISRMPEVNNIIINPFPHGKINLLQRIKSGFNLRKNNYNQVIVLPNSLKSAITPFFAKIKKRTGFVGESRYGLLNDIYKLDKAKLPLMIDRFCALNNNGKKPDIIEWPELSVDTINQKSLLEKFNINSEIPIIAFCPAAEYGPAKRWPPEYFAELADLLSCYQIIILGSSKDTEISNSIINKIHNKTKIFDLCGKTSLSDTVDILAMAKYVITNDSGLMHIACTTNTNVIAIYGSTSTLFTPPLSKKAQVLQVKLDCSPCFERTCRFGHYNCLNNITPDLVMKQLSSTEIML
jgi:heptosyltransferase-2